MSSIVRAKDAPRRPGRFLLAAFRPLAAAMNSKSIRKLVRRLQFARIVAQQPRYAKAAYLLIRRPQELDPLTLGGLAESELLPSILSSPLMWTGNAHVPLRLAKNLYLNGRRDQAFSIVRRSPGGGARMLEGELLMYSGDIARARSIFSAAADRAATKAGALRNMAVCHYLEGDMDAAIDTIIVAAAMYPRNMPSMTFFSRIVRNSEDIDRYLREKLRIAKHGLTPGSSAQLVRACGRAGAKRTAEMIASDAIINMCSSRRPEPEEAPEQSEQTAPKGSYSSENGDLILEHISSVVDEANVRLFLMGGTLLGLIRDNQLLPWDKDLDFGCFAEDASISDLWQIFLDSPYFVPMGVVGDRLIKLRHMSGVTVDIFVNFKENDVRWHGGQFICWRDKAFSLDEVTLQDRRFYIPRDPEAYLAGHYGEAWSQPDPDFDVFWEAPNAFNANPEHRYLNTIAKGLQFLGARSPNTIRLRYERAMAGGAADVAEGYRYVLGRYDEFRLQ